MITHRALTLFIIALIFAISVFFVKKNKFREYYYSILHYKKKLSQDGKFYSKCINKLGLLFIFTFIYLISGYNQLSDYYNKIKPLFPDKINGYLASLKGHDNTSIIFLLIIEILAIIFLYLTSIRATTSQKNKIINELNIGEIIKYKKIKILSYFGSIEDVSEIQVIVTSENSDLELASLSSTSVSGRIRNMASTRDHIGNVISDPLYDNICKFKKENKKHSNFNLGACVISQPSELNKYGIEFVIHAISIKKNNDNSITYDASAIKKIISFCIRECLNNSLNSIFIPIFGIGSALQAPEKIITEQLKIIKGVVDSEMHNSDTNHHINIYLGIYRELDFLFLKKESLKIFG